MTTTPAPAADQTLAHAPVTAATVAELDALPVGSVVVDGVGRASQRHHGPDPADPGWYRTGESTFPAGRTPERVLRYGPVTVIYRPDVPPVTAPDPAPAADRTPALPEGPTGLVDVTAACLLATRWDGAHLGVNNDGAHHEHNYSYGCPLCRPDRPGAAARIVTVVLREALDVDRLADQFARSWGWYGPGETWSSLGTIEQTLARATARDTRDAILGEGA